MEPTSQTRYLNMHKITSLITVVALFAFSTAQAVSIKPSDKIIVEKKWVAVYGKVSEDDIKFTIEY